MNNYLTWILVEVRSGIPTSIKAFPTEKQAKEEESKLREKLNLDNDETAIFPLIMKEKWTQ